MSYEPPVDPPYIPHLRGCQTNEDADLECNCDEIEARADGACDPYDAALDRDMGGG